MTTRKSGTKAKNPQTLAQYLDLPDGGPTTTTRTTSAEPQNQTLQDKYTNCICVPPSRKHKSAYHYPLLLTSPTTSPSTSTAAATPLLTWFTAQSATRNMPWRKPWLDPSDPNTTPSALSTRAYEIWVSEIMLQQTRVATVIPYYERWIKQWPTVRALAAASEDEVLAAWKGLGYYGRARRLWVGARGVVERCDGDAEEEEEEKSEEEGEESEKEKGKEKSKKGEERCEIPSSVEELLKIEGVGRYTAGAISSIAFGEAEPLLDGNVVRVLTRQLGLFVDGKEKKGSDLLWMVADELVKRVSGWPDKGRSEVPGLWNQALMELGATVCTPRPRCEACPIRGTCRVYQEGEVLVGKKSKGIEELKLDEEDGCSFCDEVDIEDLFVGVDGDKEKDEEGGKGSKKRKREPKRTTNTISKYFKVNTRSTTASRATSDESDEDEMVSTKRTSEPDTSVPSSQAKMISKYCSLFPKKIIKKKVPEEESVVCFIELRRRGTSKWLIEQRPAKGLLASLWQFPQATLPKSNSHSATERKTAAKKFVSDQNLVPIDTSKAKYLGEVDSILHIFSHLKLTMHVHRFRIDLDTKAVGPEPALSGPRKWVDTDDMENQTLSTGMRRCWELVHAQEEVPR